MSERPPLYRRFSDQLLLYAIQNLCWQHSFLQDFFGGFVGAILDYALCDPLTYSVHTHQFVLAGRVQHIGDGFVFRQFLSGRRKIVLSRISEAINQLTCILSQIGSDQRFGSRRNVFSLTFLRATAYRPFAAKRVLLPIIWMTLRPNPKQSGM
jgi:hypothetical protein